jgi:hypothetical protein
MHTRNLFLLSLIALAPACGAPAEDLAEDQIESAQTDEGKSDEPGSTYTYYSVRPDLRRCVAPLCGGVWVKRVNQTWTRCADGQWTQDECYVANVDYSKLGISQSDYQEIQANASKLMLRGNIRAKKYGSFGNLGEFNASEAWIGQGDAPVTGIFYRVKDNGLRCIAAPCPTYHEAKLNSAAHRNIAELDFSATGADQKEIDAAYQALFSTEGVLVAGSHFTVTGPAGRGLGLKASQFWIKVKSRGCSPVFCALYCEYGFKKGANGCEVCSCNPAPSPYTAPECKRGGCSGQICQDMTAPDVITTCEWRPEYACYQKARCEVQNDGHCGFSQTAELTTCLGN